ncbi:MAG: AAA family ATPase, partial [Dehalococcoidia bacterium]|nr:AAA family ATPase [Dehalococcoidia bacterium]
MGDNKAKRPKAAKPKVIVGTFRPKKFADHTNSPYLIKDEPPSYYPRHIGGTLDTIIIENAVRDRGNILLIGETGTGKSHVLRLTAYRLGLPYVRVQLYDAISPEDLFG